MIWILRRQIKGPVPLGARRFGRQIIKPALLGLLELVLRTRQRLYPIKTVLSRDQQSYRLLRIRIIKRMNKIEH